MQKSTAIIWVAIFSFLMIFFIVGESDSEEPAWWNPVDYAHITDLDYKAVVVDEPDSDGKLNVTQRITYDVHAFSRDNLFWELWRDMPELLVDDVNVEYNVKSVKQITNTGDTFIYEESPSLYWLDRDYTDNPKRWFYSEGPYNERRRQYESLLIYIDGTYREQMTFEIEYEVTNMSLRYNDCSELYISFYSEETIQFLKSFKAEILVPIDKMPREGNYSAYTYGTNHNDFPYTESDSLNPGFYTFKMELDKAQLKFRPYNRYLEFSLISYGEDMHSFTQYVSENKYYNDDALSEIRAEQTIYEEVPHTYFIYKIIFLIILVIASLLILWYALRSSKRLKKKYVFFNPQKNISYDFTKDSITIEPALAVALLNAKKRKNIDVEKVYMGTMMSLVDKGYISFTQKDPSAGWDTNNIQINILDNQRDPLTEESFSVDNPQNTNNDISNVTLHVSDQHDDLHTPQHALSLTKIEKIYFDLIKRHAYNFATLNLSVFYKSLENDYVHTTAVLEQINSEILSQGVSRGYFQKIDYKEPAKALRKKSVFFIVTGALITVFANLLSYFTRFDFAFGGYFILGLTLIFSGIYMNKISPRFALLTESGENMYAKLQSFYQFLNTDESIKNSDIKSVSDAEKFLVYATAFGITGVILKRLKHKFPEISNSPILKTPYTNSSYRGGHYHGSHGRYNGSRRNSFTSSVRRASVSGRAGGGGYGGAGRGGGGGGGGH